MTTINRKTVNATAWDLVRDLETTLYLYDIKKAASLPEAPSRLWIGFIELEAWAEAVFPGRPALLLPVVQKAGVAGTGVEEDLLVVCQQVSPAGDVLYCHLRAGTVARRCGRLVEDGWRQRAMAWESLCECVRGYLEEQGLRVIPATAACRSDAELLLGHANGIAYDETQNRFRRRGVPDCGAEAA